MFRQSLAIVALVVIAVGAGTFAAARWPVAHDRGLNQSRFSRPASQNATEHDEIGGYVIEATREGSGGRLRISKDGKTVLERTGGRFLLNCCDDENEHNLTGDSVPGMAVLEWSGGAHCCFQWRFFRMRTTVSEIGVIPNDNSDECPLRDLNDDGTPEVVVEDWTFSHWGTSFESAPTFSVVYRYENGKYKISDDLMREDAPTAEDIEAWAADMDWTGGVPTAFWEGLLELISTGNADMASRYIDQVWPKDVAGRDRFMSEFYEQLGKSPYWADLQRLNHGLLPKPQFQRPQ